MSTPTPTQVRDRLDRLAGQAPAGVVDPDRIWAQGRRRQRGRWAGTAAALVVLAVLGAVAVPPALQRTQGLVAVSPDSALRLPDVIRQPGEWEGSFPGAPGPLVAVGLGTRGGWWSPRNAWWGVSATTGESRFLDLPDAATTTDATTALSADGRRLAYWFAGRTAGEPLRMGDQDPTVGVAVIDLMTGEVARWDAETDHGLRADGLAWAGDVLWWSGGAYDEGGTAASWSARIGLHTWDVSTDERRDIARGTPGAGMTVSVAGPAPDGFLAPARRHALELVTGDEVGTAVRPDVDLVSQYGNAPAVSPDGRRVAGVQEPDDGDLGAARMPLLVGELDNGTAEMVRVGDLASTVVFGWRSNDQVVVQTHRGDDLDRVYGASAVDVDTGEVTPLTEFRGNAPSVAADAWSAEVIEAPDAPWAPDPRFVGLVLLVVGTFVVSLVNSVRRRRGRA